MRTSNEIDSLMQNYWTELFGTDQGLKRQAKENSISLNLQGISISSSEAQIISFLVKSFNCKKFVEVGTLTGYSALWILEALPQNGQFWTFEKDPKHAELALQVLKNDSRAQVQVGDAKTELEKITNHGPFDGIFIDGNKAAYPDYLAWAEKHLKVGGLIIADNVYLGGNVYGHPDKRFSEKQILAMKKFNRRISDKNLFDSVIVPTTEGLFIAIKK